MKSREQKDRKNELRRKRYAENLEHRKRRLAQKALNSKRYYADPIKCEKRKARCKAFRKTSNGILIGRKHRAKQRLMKFIPINKYFENSHAHHINEIYVIYIPKEIHKAIGMWHSHYRPETMIEINIAAFQFMNPDCYLHLVENYTLNF